jgi:hypothetical protein
MFTKKGVVNIVLVSLILGFSLSLASNLENFSQMFLISLALVLTNVLFKEFTANYYDLKIEHNIWEIKRYWFHPGSHFKKPFPIGVLAPILSFVFTAGYFIWMSILTFSSRPEIYRVAKRRGFYGYSDSSELHEGIVALFGLLGNVLLGVVGLLFGFHLFAQLNFLYAFCCSIPLGNLDGNKILFAEPFLSKLSIILTGCLWIFSVVFL